MPIAGAERTDFDTPNAGCNVQNAAPGIFFLPDRAAAPPPAFVIFMNFYYVNRINQSKSFSTRIT